MNLKILCFMLLFNQIVLADTQAYRFSRPIIWQAKEQQELLAVALDKEIYAATRFNFADLRLMDQNNIEQPYLIAKAVETKTRNRRLACKSKVNTLTKQNNTIEIQLTLDERAKNADGLTIQTPLKNFEHDLQIFGSDSGNNWTELVDHAVIFDYSRFMNLSNRDVKLPKNSFRKFKILVKESVQTHESYWLELTRKFKKDLEFERTETVNLQRVPLKINQINLWRTETEVQPKTEKHFDYPLAEFKVDQDKKNQLTLIDVSTNHEPLTGFRVKSSSTNFNRKASVQIPEKHGIETVMKTIGSTTLKSIKFRDFSRNVSVIRFPEQHQKNYRIIIENQDNPPLQISSVTGIGPEYQLLFLPQADTTYSLHYGSNSAVQPKYETAAIRELLRRGYHATKVSLGQETSTKSLIKTFNWSNLLNSRWFLVMTVILMVLALWWSLAMAIKHSEAMTKK